MANGRSINSSKVKKKMIDESGPICAICQTEHEYLQLDHKVPLWNGGTNKPDNLQLLCGACHMKKTKAEFPEYCRTHPGVYIKDGVIMPGKGKYNG